MLFSLLVFFFQCVLPFVAVVVIVVYCCCCHCCCVFTYLFYRLYTGGRGDPISVIPAPLCDDLNSCNRNSVESDMGYIIRSKRGTVQP